MHVTGICHVCKERGQAEETKQTKLKCTLRYATNTGLQYSCKKFSQTIKRLKQYEQNRKNLNL